MAKHNHNSRNSGPIEKLIMDSLNNPKLSDREKATRLTATIASLPTFELREGIREKFPELKDMCMKVIKKIDEHGII